MIHLSLKQFAQASGASPKWVLNARPRLGRPIAYTDTDARWVRLARALNRDVGIPLRAAANLARGALRADAEDTDHSRRAHSKVRSTVEPPRRARLVNVDTEGIRLTVDLRRFESTFAAALSAALAFGANRRAGRKRRVPAHTGAALRQAWRCAIDLGPLRARARAATMARVARPNATPATLVRRQINLSAELRLPNERACEAILHTLTEHRVRFVLVGEVAELNGGAPPIPDKTTATPVLDICYADSVANMRRLSAALRVLGAQPLAGEAGDNIEVTLHRDVFDPNHTRPLDPVTLQSATALAFSTRSGPIHVRREVAGVGGFRVACWRVTCVRTYGRELAVLDVPSLAAARTASGTCGDIARLPVLETLMVLPALEDRYRAPLTARLGRFHDLLPSTPDDSCPKTPRRPCSPSSGSTRASPIP